MVNYSQNWDLIYKFKMWHQKYKFDELFYKFSKDNFVFLLNYEYIYIYIFYSRLKKGNRQIKANKTEYTLRKLINWFFWNFIT